MALDKDTSQSTASLKDGRRRSARRKQCQYCPRKISPRTMTKHVNAKHSDRMTGEARADQYLRQAIVALYKTMKKHVLQKNNAKAYQTAKAIDELEQEL